MADRPARARLRRALAGWAWSWGGDLRTAAVGLGLVGALGLSFWWANHARGVADQRLLAAHAGADYFVTGLRARTRAADGRTTSELAAERLVHYGRDGHAVAHTPALRRFRDDGATLDIQAGQGTFNDHPQTVRLEGDVQVRLQRGPQAHPVTARMPHLVYDLDTDRARTDAPVRIESGGTVTLGQGLDFDAATSRLGLGGRVRATISPRSQP